MKKKARPRSVSALKTYQRCPVQFRFRYVEDVGVPSTRNVPSIRGLAVDDAVTFNLGQKIRTGADLDTKDVVEVAVESVEAAFHGPLHLTAEEKAAGTKGVKGRTKDMVVGMTRSYHNRLSPFTRPAAVKREIVVEPDPEVFPRPLIGFIDYDTVDGLVLDLKTKEKALVEGVEHRDQQLTMYAMLYHAATGRRPSGVGFDVVTAAPGAAGATVERRLSSRTDEDVRGLLLRLNETERAIGAGLFPPTDPTSWACSVKWCEYWDRCPYVRGDRRRL